MSDTDTEPPQPLFDRTAGVEFFESLVDRFYEGVMADPVLAPLYEVDDIDGARHRLTMFLVQYFGGPTTYNDERGHPRLRMRHAPYAIGELERYRYVVLGRGCGRDVQLDIEDGRGDGALGEQCRRPVGGGHGAVHEGHRGASARGHWHPADVPARGRGPTTQPPRKSEHVGYPFAASASISSRTE